jgi:hypothetical protein
MLCRTLCLHAGEVNSGWTFTSRTDTREVLTGYNADKTSTVTPTIAWCVCVCVCVCQCGYMSRSCSCRLGVWCSQVSVGRLGIITEMDFNIIPQAVVQRDHMTLTFDQFVAEIKIIQDTYNMAKSMGLDTWPALSFLNEVQVRFSRRQVPM